MKTANGLFLLALSALLMLGVSRCLTSCKTIKEVQVEKVVVDSSVVRQRDSLSSMIAEIQVMYEKELNSLVEGMVLFQNTECDTIIIDSTCNIDSAVKVIKLLQNRVRILKDGTIEYEGKIKSANIKLESIDREANSLLFRFEKLNHVKDSLAAELQKEKLSKSKEVKRKPKLGFLNGILFIFAVVLGIAIERKFKVSRIIKPV